MSTQRDVTFQARASCSGDPPSLGDFKEQSTPKKVPWSARLLSVTLFVVAGAAAAGGRLALMSHASSWLALAAFMSSGFFLISGVVVPLGIIRERNFEIRAEEECHQESKDLNWALCDIEDHTLKGL